MSENLTIGKVIHVKGSDDNYLVVDKVIVGRPASNYPGASAIYIAVTAYVCLKHHKKDETQEVVLVFPESISFISKV